MFSTEKTREFEYLLNAMEHAGNQENPAQHDYFGKRQAVLKYVAASEQRVKEMMEALPRWIPVEERLPDTSHGVLVLIRGSDEAKIAHYINSDAGWYGVNDRPVTHWQPILSAPGARAVLAEERGR